MHIKRTSSYTVNNINVASRPWGLYCLSALAFMLAALAGNAQDNQWTWMNGTSSISQPGVYGTQGTAAVSNHPGGRNGCMTWRDTSGNLWLFGGLGYASTSSSITLNDLWKYEISTGMWTWMNGANSFAPLSVYGTQGIAAAANRPGARSAAMTWTDASGCFWLFGGLGYDPNSPAQGPLSDLWKYDPSTNQWTWVNGAIGTYNAGVYGTQGTAAAANTPGGRQGAVSWTDVSGDLWLFGGAPVSNDLWKYNPSTNQWTWVGGPNTFSQTGVYGIKGTAAAANIPGARQNAAGWKDTSGNFWLFGGYGLAKTTSSGHLGDLWKYDPATGQWTWISGADVINEAATYGTKGISSAANKPGRRLGAEGWADAYGRFWIFGGHVNANNQNDLWKYDPAADQWTWVNGGNSFDQNGVYGTQGSPAATNTPGARYSVASWTDASGKFWLFGGRTYSDLWRYAPAVIPPDTTFSVTGGGSYCPGGSGVPVGLSGSEATTSYQLRLNGSNTGNPVAGTGSSISFGNRTAAGIYTVRGINSDGAVTMTGSTTVSIAAPMVDAGTDRDICVGDSLTLSASGNVSTFVWSSGVPDGVAFTLPPPPSGTICATANENQLFTIVAPAGAVFTQVLFASYGTPSGSCGSFQTGNCDAASSQSVMETKLLGKNAVTFQVTNSLFGDPCSGTPKKLAVQAFYALPPGAPRSYVVIGTDTNGCSDTDVVLVNIRPLPTVSAGADQSICSGDSIMLKGSGTISYAWDNGINDNKAFSPLATATYTVSGKDSFNCINTDQVQVTVKQLPVVDAGQDHSVCLGTLTSLSGTGAASYVWNNNIIDGAPFTALSGGTYTVTGTAADGCVGTDYVTLTVLNPPDATISPSSDSVSLCKSDCSTAVLNVPEIAGNIYTWKKNDLPMPGTGISSVTATTTGSYTVTVSNTCGVVTSSPVVVSVATPPVVSLTASATTICEGNTAVLSGSAANNYQWYWEGMELPGATGQNYDATVAGKYTLKSADNNGCYGVSKALNIKVNPMPSADFTVYNVYPNGTLRLRGSQASAAYQWYLNDMPIPGALGRSHIVTQTGDYHLQITKGICTAASPDTTIILNTAVAKMMGGASATASGNIQIVPNPSSGIFKILTDAPVQAVVKNIQGQTLLTTEDEEIDLLDKPAGIYMLELYNMQGVLIKTEKLVKQ